AARRRGAERRGAPPARTRQPGAAVLPAAHRDPDRRVLRTRDDLRDDDGVLPRHEQVPRLLLAHLVVPDAGAVRRLQAREPQVGALPHPVGTDLRSGARGRVDGIAPGPYMLLAATGWAVIALLFGAYIFISRERDFAVRI